METLSELMARPDVQYHIQKKVISAKQEVVQKYAQRVNSFYHSFSYHWIFHKRALRILQQDYDISERQFEILMASYSLANAWDCNGVIGSVTLYNLFFSDTSTSGSFIKLLKGLRDKKFLATMSQSGLTAKARIKLKSLKSEHERLVMITPLAMEIPRRYNIIMGKQITMFAREQGSFKAPLIRIITWLLGMRRDLAGSNKDLLKQFDEAIIHSANETDPLTKL